MSLADGKLLTTRDFNRFRAVASPIAPIAQCLFTLLTSSTPAGISARSAFLASHLSEIDDVTIRDLFTKGWPRVVLAQGTKAPPPLPSRSAADSSEDVRTNGVVGSPTSSILTKSTATSKATGVLSGSAVDPHDVIYVPNTLHQALADATADDDAEESANLKLFVAATLVHETAHWLSIHLGRESGARRGSNASNFGHLANGSLTPCDHSDCGVQAVEAMWGHLYSLLTFADGTHQVVSSSPAKLASTRSPGLTLKSQMALVGGKLPPTLDVSKWKENGQVRAGAKAPWKSDDAYLVGGVMESGAFCQHF